MYAIGEGSDEPSLSINAFFRTYTEINKPCFFPFSTAFTAETAFVITTSPNKLYKVTLTGASHSVEEILTLGSAASGIVYNDFNDKIVWGEAGNIRTMPVTGSTPNNFAGKSIP